MYQNRRKFIKNSLLFAAAASSATLFAKNWSINTAIFDKDDLMGKGTPTLYGDGFNLRKDAAESLKLLIAEAKKSGFNPHVVSSFRNYARQKRIWDNKYTKFTQEEKLSPIQAIKKIVRYSTIPGTSRHHWGTDFDVVDGAKGIVANPLHEKHFNKGGVYHEFKKWMNENAQVFGFYEVYTNQAQRKGFEYEPWHFSYLPTACEMMREYINQNIFSTLKNSDIKGSEHFTQEFMNDYYAQNILDINPELKP